MSTLKANAVTSRTTDSALTLSGNGTGGVKVNDYFVQTKGDDIASGTTLTLGKDGNQFDVTGTTTITSIATQGIGSYVTLHFDGALTFTHDSADLILPGAANITTAAGDIAVMYEYASADWRCVSYTKAAGTAVVSAGGNWEFVEGVALSGNTTEQLAEGNIDSGYVYIATLRDIKPAADCQVEFAIGTGGGPTYQTSGYVSTIIRGNAGSIYGENTITDAIALAQNGGGAGGATETTNGFIEIYSAAETDTTFFYASIAIINSDAAIQWGAAAGAYTATTAITGFQLQNSGGQTLDTGTFAISRRKLS